MKSSPSGSETVNSTISEANTYKEVLRGQERSQERIMPNFEKEVVIISDRNKFDKLKDLYREVEGIHISARANYVTSTQPDALQETVRKSNKLTSSKYNIDEKSTLEENVTRLKQHIRNALLTISTVDDKKVNTIITEISTLSGTVSTERQKTFLANLINALNEHVKNFKRGIFVPKNGIYSLLAIATVALLSLLRPAKDQNYT